MSGSPTTKKTNKTAQAGIVYGMAPNGVDAVPLTVNLDGTLAVSGGSGGGGGSSDTTEATQLLVLSELQQIEAKSPALVGGRVPVDPANVSNKLRVSCEANPNADANFTVAAGSGDVIINDGNTASASYWVISKDPFAVGTESTITSDGSWGMPLEAAVHLSLSQRTLGQEFAIELVSDEAALAAPADLAISSIQQATTTLTISTALPHGLTIGTRVGVRDCADSRMNYPALVVATAPTANTFTATAGPGGNLSSVTAGPFTTGFVYIRPALGFARNGTSMIFENPTATNASFYVRSDAGDALPSGSIAANHSASILATTSVQPVASPRAYIFQPSAEHRIILEPSRVQFSDIVPDSINANNARHTRNQVIPDITQRYKFRIRARNNASLTKSVAHIQSVTKTGTTTATVVTQTAHGLTVGDVIAAYGVRDQTNFANLAVATAVASIVDANTFTVVWGSAVTASSQAGVIYRVNGSNLPSALGAIAQVVQSVTRISNVLTLVGSAAWTGLLIGDYINLAALHDTAGADLLLDGSYRVRNIATTTLELEPIGSAPMGTDIALTNCGGAVVKRTDLRIHSVRIADYTQQRVEMSPKAFGDGSGAAVNVAQGALSSVTTVSTLTGGAAAESAATTSNPLIVGGVVRTATSPTTLVAGDAARITMTSAAAHVMYPFAVPEVSWQAPSPTNGIVNTTVPYQLKEPAGALLRNYVASIDLSSDALTNATDLRIREPDITCNSQTITANTLVTSAAHDLAIGDAVVFSASTVTGITAGVTYFVLTVPSATSITLTTFRGGTVKAISGTAVTATFHKVLWQTRIPTTGVAPRQVKFSVPLRGSINRALQVFTATASGAGAVHVNAQGFISQ